MSLYMIADVRFDMTTIGSPPYQAFLAWCADNDIPVQTGWQVRAYDETPLRAELDVIDLDDQGEWIMGEGGVPVTHTVTYYPDVLPPIQGHMPRLTT